MNKTLTAAQNRAIGLLAAGATKSQVATEVKVSRQTLYEWLKLPEFENHLHELRQASAKESFNRAISMVDDSLDVIFGLMTDPETPATVRLSAAAKILEFGRGVWADLDVEHRLHQVEVNLGIKEAPTVK